MSQLRFDTYISENCILDPEITRAFMKELLEKGMVGRFVMNLTNAKSIVCERYEKGIDNYDELQELPSNMKDLCKGSYSGVIRYIEHKKMDLSKILPTMGALCVRDEKNMEVSVEEGKTKILIDDAPVTLDDIRSKLVENYSGANVTLTFEDKKDKILREFHDLDEKSMPQTPLTTPIKNSGCTPENFLKFGPEKLSAFMNNNTWMTLHTAQYAKDDSNIFWPYRINGVMSRYEVPLPKVLQNFLCYDYLSKGSDIGAAIRHRLGVFDDMNLTANEKMQAFKDMYDAWEASESRVVPKDSFAMNDSWFQIVKDSTFFNGFTMLYVPGSDCWVFVRRGELEWDISHLKSARSFLKKFACMYGLLGRLGADVDFYCTTIWKTSRKSLNKYLLKENYELWKENSGPIRITTTSDKIYSSNDLFDLSTVQGVDLNQLSRIMDEESLHDGDIRIIPRGGKGKSPPPDDALLSMFDEDDENRQNW